MKFTRENIKRNQRLLKNIQNLLKIRAQRKRRTDIKSNGKSLKNSYRPERIERERSERMFPFILTLCAN